MSQPTEPSPDSHRQEGISLEELAEAFAQVMGTAPRLRPAAEESSPPPSDSDQSAAPLRQTSAAQPAVVELASEAAARDDACPLSPRSILEAMLFVGNHDNKPLSAVKAAELMRDVAPQEIPQIVDEINRHYDADNCPYHIISQGDGYRLTLRKTYTVLRNKFYGRIREARLSQAAIDVLAIIAYQQPLTGEQVSRLRGKPSSHILTQLVRRGLLRIERPETKRRTPHYYTTERFLRLFNLQSLADLPHSEDAAQ
jgi:segregation and condensation protein B